MGKVEELEKEMIIQRDPSISMYEEAIVPSKFLEEKVQEQNRIKEEKELAK
jgi:hypothetical protein